MKREQNKAKSIWISKTLPIYIKFPQRLIGIGNILQIRRIKVPYIDKP